MILGFIVKLAFLISVVLFIWGLRLLGSPDTARKGNILAAIGMGIGMVAALIMSIEGPSYGNYPYIIGGIIVGGIIGQIAAKKVQMTAMPQLVSIFNGLGGLTAVLLSMAEFRHYYDGTKPMDQGTVAILILALFIGAVAFTGSILAYLKLDGKVKDKYITFNGHNILNILFLIGLIAISVMMVMNGQSMGIQIAVILMIVSLIYGWSFVAPIGGADMPVVISLLNSFSGLSAAAAGIVYGNMLMIVGGILVGASGTILTVMMTQAMNRSLINVLIGGFSSSGGGSSAGADGDQVAKEVSPNDLAIQLFYANSVMFVPGYGLAVAQAQKVLKELDDMLEANGVEVSYAIHPVAGRMPGHMNVLLAEADVPYPKLLDLDEANAALPGTDMVVIIGANDVVNPAAETDPSSKIYGMPVLQVWKAKNVVIMKRSMSPGYAGIQNQLFFNDNSKMLFGDGKASINKVISEVKNL